MYVDVHVLGATHKVRTQDVVNARPLCMQCLRFGLDSTLYARTCAICQDM